MAKKLSEVERKASLKVLQDYRGEASRLMKDKMVKAKKGAKTSEQAAMDEASDLLDKDDEDTELEECGEEMTEDDSSENEDELDQKIEELMRRKKAMSSK